MKHLLWLILLPATALTAPIKGFNKTYQDWDLICDNTGTCHMAGYQADEDFDRAVSLLFTRAAGENTPIRAKLALWPYNNENDKELQLSDTSEIILNGQSLGTIQNMTDAANLDVQQTAALLAALKSHADIQIVSGEFKGKLSDKGAAAAMLKMDEFQQRLNTPSALIRQGQEKHAVLAPQAVPQINAIRVNPQKTTTLEPGNKQFNAILALLRQSNGINENAEDYCYVLHDKERENLQITLYPLTQGKVLAETLCWLGAYQSGNYYAVMDEKLSKVEQVLANQYEYADYDEKTHGFLVSGSFKGRGIGDCWGGQEAIWNGKIFIRSKEWTTGSCKGFTGGAWQLPIFESNIKVK